MKMAFLVSQYKRLHQFLFFFNSPANLTPVPQPQTKDTLLQKARASYETIAKKAGETTAYPGNWLYQTWSGMYGSILL